MHAIITYIQFWAQTSINPIRKARIEFWAGCYSLDCKTRNTAICLNLRKSTWHTGLARKGIWMKLLCEVTLIFSAVCVRSSQSTHRTSEFLQTKELVKLLFKVTLTCCQYVTLCDTDVFQIRSQDKCILTYMSLCMTTKHNKIKVILLKSQLNTFAKIVEKKNCL